MSVLVKSPATPLPPGLGASDLGLVASGASKVANVGMRRRHGAARRVDGLENLSKNDSVSLPSSRVGLWGDSGLTVTPCLAALVTVTNSNRKRVQHMRRIADCVLNLDLETTLFLMKDASPESRRANILHHFERRYQDIQPIYAWLERAMPTGSPPSGSLQHEGVDDDGQDGQSSDGGDGDEHNPLDDLTEQQLAAILREANAKKFWPRMLLGRILELKEQLIVHGQMREDFRVAFELNLGVLLESAPPTENEYIRLVVANLQAAELRLKNVVAGAVLLRDHVRAAAAASGPTAGGKAGESPVLDKSMLVALRQRLVALEEEHYFEAWTLVKDKDPRLGREENQRLVNPEVDTWLPRTDEDEYRQEQPQPADARMAEGGRQIASATSSESLGSTQSASIAVLMGLSTAITVLALLPACASFQQLDSGRGNWFDANFYNLVASGLLQLLGLLVQVLAPLKWPAIFRSRLAPDAKYLVWAVSGLACLCTILAIVLYGSSSSLWSAIIGFAAQSFLGLIQLVLVFGPSSEQGN